MSSLVCLLCQAPASLQCSHCDAAWSCCPAHLKVHRPGETCFPFVICHSPSKGRHMVATATVRACETILVERAIMLGPKLQGQAVCLECFSPIRKQVVPCLECQAPFCSEQCRHKMHTGGKHGKQECNILKQAELSLADLHPDTGVLGAVGVLRYLLVRKKVPLVDLLVDHKELLRQDDDTGLQDRVITFLIERCKLYKLNKDDIQRALGVLKSNSVNVAGFRARGLFQTMSMANHSCCCNARHMVCSEEGIIQVVAQRTIKKGEEINIRYSSDVLQPVLHRRRQLSSQWHFSCVCPRCTDPTELGTFVSALQCHECDDGFVLPKNSLDDESVWVCETCDNTYTAEKAQDIVDGLAREYEEVDKECTEDVEEFLKHGEALVHPDHCLLVKAKMLLFSLYGSVTGFLAPALSTELVARKLELGEDLLHILGKLDAGRTQWRGDLLAELGRPVLVAMLEKLELREMEQGEFRKQLGLCVAKLEEAVSCLEGEPYVAYQGLTDRVKELAKTNLLGKGYNAVFNKIQKLTFI